MLEFDLSVSVHQCEAVHRHTTVFNGTTRFAGASCWMLAQSTSWLVFVASWCLAVLPDDEDAKSGGAMPKAKPKRQPWDVKGRLEDMEVMLRQRGTVTDSLQQQLISNNQRIEQLEGQKEALCVNVEKQCEQALIIGEQNSDLCQRLR